MVRRTIAALLLALAATACSGGSAAQPAPASPASVAADRTNVVPVGDRTLTTDNVPHVP